MLPLERGGYGQLPLPPVTAIAIGRPTVPAVALGGAAVAALLAHEPVVVLLGNLTMPAAQRDTVAATTCVRAVIEATRHSPATASRTAGAAVAATTMSLLIALSRAGWIAAVGRSAAAPMIGGAVVLALLSPSARQLRV